MRIARHDIKHGRTPPFATHRDEVIIPR
jgi:hypothetical protein